MGEDRWLLWHWPTTGRALEYLRVTYGWSLMLVVVFCVLYFRYLDAKAEGRLDDGIDPPWMAEKPGEKAEPATPNPSPLNDRGVPPRLDDATQRTQSPRRAWTAVLLLALVGTLNYIDRFLPAVLAEPIRIELALSDTAIGVINGFGFLVVYAVVGIAIARVADRGAFGLVISTSLTLWGAMTMLGGAVVSGFQLALTRVGVAIGEAGSTTCRACVRGPRLRPNGAQHRLPSSRCPFRLPARPA